MRAIQNSPFVPVPGGQRQLMVACAFCYALFVLFLSLTVQGGSSDRFIVLVTSLFYLAVLALPLYHKSAKDGYLHPLVLTSSMMLLQAVLGQTDVLATGLAFHTGLRGWSQADLSHLVAYVNVVASISLLAKYGGYYSSGTTSITVVRFNNRPNKFFLPLLVIWGLLGLAAMYIIIQGSGGLETHLSNMNRGAAVKVIVAHERLLGGAAFVVQSTIVIPILYAAFRPNGHKSFMFVVLVLISAVMAYLTAGRRAAIVNPAFFAIAIWIYKERKLPLIRVLGIGIALFLFVAIGGVWRESNRRLDGGINWDFLEGMTVQQLAEKSMQELSDRAGSSDAVYPIVAKVPRQIPFTYGVNYFENLYRFIPRAIWRDKPDGIGIACAEKFYNRYDQGGIPPGALGEAYWSLHIPGVIIVFFVFGAVLRVFANTFSSYPDAIGMVVIYVLTLMRLAPDQISFRVWIFTIIPTLAFLTATNLLVLRR